MTTQSPHGPSPHRGGYPTAPPWAPPATPPGREPWTGHGRLMVPYPEEIARANRSRPPSWVPVVIWTLLFWPFGLVSARRRARQALISRNDRHPYWIAFGLTLLVIAAAAAVYAAQTVGVPG